VNHCARCRDQRARRGIGAARHSTVTTFTKKIKPGGCAWPRAFLFLLLSHNIHTCQAGALQSKPPAAAAFAALSFAVTATTFIHALQASGSSDSILCPPVSVYCRLSTATSHHDPHPHDAKCERGLISSGQTAHDSALGWEALGARPRGSNLSVMSRRGGATPDAAQRRSVGRSTLG